MTLSILKSKLGLCSCKGCFKISTYEVSIYPTNRTELTIDMNLCDIHTTEALSDGANEEVRLI